MKKKFDSVGFQRRIRKELSENYSANPKEFLQELKDKYGHLPKRKANA
jgi:hypothetical protein